LFRWSCFGRAVGGELKEGTHVMRRKKINVSAIHILGEKGGFQEDHHAKEGGAYVSRGSKEEEGLNFGRKVSKRKKEEVGGEDGWGAA